MTGRAHPGRFAGKVAVVTGAAQGIGEAVARRLSAESASVVLVDRSDLVHDVAKSLLEEGGDAHGVTADLEQYDGAEAAVSAATERHGRLDVLVNNVGGYWAHRHITADGLEQTFALNHLAPFLLTNLLLERLKESRPSRVVTVSSGAQAMGRIDFEDLQGEHGYNGQRAYNQSKLANVLFSYELARRTEGTGVTANALHPGVVATDFGREDAHGWMRVMLPFVHPFMKSPEKGAATSVYLASSPEVAGVSGRYFIGARPRRSAPRSYDEQVARRLWDVSARLTGLSSSSALETP